MTNEIDLDLRDASAKPSDAAGESGRKSDDLHPISTGPLYVLEDENGDLFLSSESTCGESTSRVVLHDVKLWDVYFESVCAMNKARQAVLDALRVPWRPTTPETLTMRQIADVKRWASENGRKGLHADALRCEQVGDAPIGAMRRICKHINDRTKPTP